jgi:hypothetical protein
MFLQSFACSYRDTLTMTDRALIEIFAHFFPYLLWLEVDGIDFFPAVTTEKLYLSSLWTEVIFPFFTKRRDIYEICVGGGHAFQYRELSDIASCVSVTREG